MPSPLPLSQVLPSWPMITIITIPYCYLFNSHLVIFASIHRAIDIFWREEIWRISKTKRGICQPVRNWGGRLSRKNWPGKTWLVEADVQFTKNNVQYKWKHGWLSPMFNIQCTLYNLVQYKCKIWLAEANPSEISRWLRFFRGRRSLALINIWRHARPCWVGEG